MLVDFIQMHDSDLDNMVGYQISVCSDDRQVDLPHCYQPFGWLNGKL